MAKHNLVTKNKKNKTQLEAVAMFSNVLDESKIYVVLLLCRSETLPVEYLSGKPLCMDQYYQILSSCRIPGPKRDTVVNHAIGKIPPTHITVVHNFQVVSLSLSPWKRSRSVKTLRLVLILVLCTVLHFGCVQQRRHPTHGWPAVHTTGEDLELIPADQQGAHRHPHLAAPQHLGQGLQQSDQRWWNLSRALLSFNCDAYTGIGLCVYILSEKNASHPS